MKKIIIVLLFSPVVLFAGNKITDSEYNQSSAINSSPDRVGKWYFGGNMGVNFWNNYFLISAEPMAGYHISSKFSLGIKLHYSYIRQDNDIEDLTYNNFGGSIFARYSPVPLGYLHSEFTYANYERYTFNSTTQTYSSDRVWVPFLLVGGGYRQPIGPNASLYGEVLFDLIQDENSPFEKWEPIVHVGAAVGF